VRKELYFGYHRLAENSFPTIYEDLVRQDHVGIAPGTTDRLLVQVLAHCQRSVPYYEAIMKEVGGTFEHDPQAYLLKLPILTKEIIREQFEQLKSSDLGQRKWYLNASGGSTGEPVQLIQDRHYRNHVTALQQFYSTWTGVKIASPEVYIWGSERDILGGNPGEKWRRFFTNKFLRRIMINAFHMTPETMHECIDLLNTKTPELIVAYPHILYELARFAEQEKLSIRTQSAIITSAGMLYPFMREAIERVFQCKVFNRYSSREVGDMAGECEFHQGLHVFPWGCYVEIVDEAGHRLPDGTEGIIVVTCLNNLAMPLLRYKLNDRGRLAADSTCPCGRRGQLLEKVSGRTGDVFRTQDGTLIDGEYFTHMLYFRTWVGKFQVIQKSYSSILFKIKLTEQRYVKEELDDITDKTRAVMGKACQVDFEFVADIPNISSGKYRYTMSGVTLP